MKHLTNADVPNIIAFSPDELEAPCICLELRFLCYSRWKGKQTNLLTTRPVQILKLAWCRNAVITYSML